MNKQAECWDNGLWMDDSRDTLGRCSAREGHSSCEPGPRRKDKESQTAFTKSKTLIEVSSKRTGKESSDLRRSWEETHKHLIGKAEMSSYPQELHDHPGRKLVREAVGSSAEYEGSSTNCTQESVGVSSVCVYG